PGLWLRTAAVWEAVGEAVWPDGVSAKVAGIAGEEDANGPTTRANARLLRDLFGNPFRPQPVINPAWLTWNDGTVRRLAETIYEQRSLPDGTLDVVRLGVLADALEDAGCTDASLLTHLRGSGTHVRGCWGLDLLLGKIAPGMNAGPTTAPRQAP